MQSPFAVFRKNAKMMTVVLTGLAMFSFVVLGSIESMPTLFPPVMGFVLGAALVWALSGKSGVEGGAIAIVGGFIGIAIMVFVAPKFFPQQSEVTLNNGVKITSKEVNGLVDQRTQVNQFIQYAHNSVRSGINPEENVQLNQPSLFGYGKPQRQDVLTSYLLNLKADEMGIVISDDTVGQFINKEVTSGRLSKSDFKKILQTMTISEKQLYDSLRFELRARMAGRILRPNAFDIEVKQDMRKFPFSNPVPGSVLPEELWDSYQKLTVTRKVDVIGFPVKSFVDSTSEPKKEELEKLFETYKSRRPNFTETNQFKGGEPGFLQPRRVQIGYFEADTKEVEEKRRTELEQETIPPQEIEKLKAGVQERLDSIDLEIAKMLDSKELNPFESKEKKQELKESQNVRLALLNSAQPVRRLDYLVLDHYEENKESLYRNVVVPLPDPPDEKPAPDVKPKGPALKPKTPATKKEEPKKTEPKKTEPKKTEPKKTEPKKTEPKKTEPKKAEPKKAEPSSKKETPAPQEIKKPATKKTEVPKPAPVKKDNKTSTGQTEADLNQVLFIEEDEKTETKPKKTPKPKVTGKETKQDSTPPVTAKKPEEKKEGDSPKDPVPPKAKGPKYRELDDELRSNIEDKVIEEQAKLKVTQRIKEARKIMRKVRDEYFAKANQSRFQQQNKIKTEKENRQKAEEEIEVAYKPGLTDAQRLTKMEEYAKMLQLKYIELEPLSGVELQDNVKKSQSALPAIDEDDDKKKDFTKYAIGDSKAGNEPISNLLFGRQTLLLYDAIETGDFPNKKEYVFWAVDEIASHTPKFEDPGIQKEVLKAFRLRQAAPLAQKRAEQVAKQLSENQLFTPLVNFAVSEMKVALIAQGMDKKTDGQEMLDWLETKIKAQQEAISDVGKKKEESPKETKTPEKKEKQPEPKKPVEPDQKKEGQKTKKNSIKITPKKIIPKKSPTKTKTDKPAPKEKEKSSSLTKPDRIQFVSFLQKTSTEEKKTTSSKPAKAKNKIEPKEKPEEKKEADPKKEEKKAETNRDKKKDLELLNMEFFKNALIFTTGTEGDNHFELSSPAHANSVLEWLETQIDIPQGDATKKKSLAKVRNQLSLSGTKDSELLTFEQTQPFPWMQLARNFSSMEAFQQQRMELRLSDPKEIKFADNKLMEYLFEKLADNETGVVSNADQSITYVVTVHDSSPDKKLGLELYREAFMREAGGFPYSAKEVTSHRFAHSILPQQYQLNADWITNLEKEYGLQYQSAP